MTVWRCLLCPRTVETRTGWLAVVLDHLDEEHPDEWKSANGHLLIGGRR